MNLFSIAFRNIKRNLNNYFLYFVSMTFSIIIYFTFKAIQYNKQVIDLTKASLKMSTGFKVSSIVIAVFAAMFIWYSNSFFTRKRKKEIALYSMLGLKKKQIGKMLFYENLVMGILALFIGILIGSIFSKLFIMILVRLISFKVEIKLVLCTKAILSTCIIFLLLFIITSLHGYSLIYRFKLIDLFKAENVGQKEPKSSIVVAILSLLLIGIGYYLAITIKYSTPRKNVATIFTILFFTVTGTYTIFSSLMVFIIRLSKRNKTRYFRGMNMLGTSHLLFRIKSHGKSLATIAVLSATTLTAMGAAACLYHEETTTIDETTPMSFVYQDRNALLDKKIDTLLKEHPKNAVKENLTVDYLNIQAKWPSLGKFSNSKSKFTYYTNDVMPISEIKKILKLRGHSSNISLGNNEAMLFFNSYSTFYIKNPINKTIFFKIGNEEIPVKIKHINKKLLVNQLPSNSSAIMDKIVVTDKTFKKLCTTPFPLRLRIINVKDSVHSKGLNKEIKKTLSANKLYNKNSLPFSSYYDNYSITMIKMGTIIFLGFFIGSVFLICTGSIIFFKQLSEANEDKNRYAILRKIGVKKSEIKKSIAGQMLFVFMLPLIIGICHSLAALSMLRLMLTVNVFYPTVITLSIYVIIYLVYYAATVNSYYKIVISNN